MPLTCFVGLRGWSRVALTRVLNLSGVQVRHLAVCAQQHSPICKERVLPGMREEDPEKGLVWAFERGRSRKQSPSESGRRGTKSSEKKVLQKPGVFYYFGHSWHLFLEK